MLIEPTIVCKNILTRQNKNISIFKLNKFSKYYEDKLHHTLNIEIEYDNTVISNLKYEGYYYHEQDGNILKIIVSGVDFKPYMKLFNIIYKFKTYHANVKPFVKACCNGKPFVILTKAHYPPLITEDGLYKKDINMNKPAIQAIIEDTTKDSVKFQIRSSKNIIPHSVQDFKIALFKDDHEVIEKAFKYADYVYEITDLQNETEYSFKIKLKMNDEHFEFKGVNNFHTKKGTVGKPAIEIRNITESSCDIYVIDFEGEIDNKIEFYIMKDGVLQKTITSNNISNNSKFPISINVDGLDMNTEYTLNYKVLDNIDDEKMFYDTHNIKTIKPEVNIDIKRVDESIEVTLLSIQNISKSYTVILKINQIETKLKFDEYPLTKSLLIPDKTFVIGDVFLNDGTNTNYLIDNQRIFNIG